MTNDHDTRVTPEISEYRIVCEKRLQELDAELQAKWRMSNRLAMWKPWIVAGVALIVVTLVMWRLFQ